MRKHTFILILMVAFSLNAQNSRISNDNLALTLDPNANNAPTMVAENVDVQTEELNDELVIDENKEVVFNETTHNFGVVAEGTKPTFTFTLLNKGTSPIVISNAKAGCGCTKPVATKAPIMPNTSGEIIVTYNSQGRPGPFTKTITITTNKGVYKVYIKGTVEKTASDQQPKGIQLKKK